MAGDVAAKNTVVYLNGYDLTDNFNSFDIGLTHETADNTPFNVDYRTKLALQLRDGTASLEGFFDADSGEVDAVMGPLIGTGSDVLTVLPEGDANSNTGYGMLCHMGTYNIPGEVAGIVGVSLEFEADGGGDRITVAHALSAENSTGNGSSIDAGSSSSNGGAAFLHVTAGTGFGTVDVDLEDSSDDSTFSTLASFTQVSSANTSERITFTGTVERYVRVAFTLTTTSSVTFFVGFQRY